MVGGEPTSGQLAPGRPAAVPCYDDLWDDVYGDMQDVGPVHRHMRRLLEGLVRDLSYETVLDVGCGAGHNAPLLSGEGRSHTGVDISGRALARAAERHPGRYLELDVERGALPERFDLVFSSLLLEHLPDDRAALRHLREMTGRWLLVTTIAGDFERHRRWDEQMGHVRNYRRGELELKLGEAGFEPLRSIYWGFPFYSPLARLLQNRMSSAPSYGAGTRLAARLMYWLYFLNSSRRGDLLIVLARPR